MAEELSDYLREMETLERVEILRDLRLGVYFVKVEAVEELPNTLVTGSMSLSSCSGNLKPHIQKMKPIQVSNLTKTFGHLIAVDRISFEVEEFALQAGAPLKRDWHCFPKVENSQPCGGLGQLY